MWLFTERGLDYAKLKFNRAHTFLEPIRFTLESRRSRVRRRRTFCIRTHWAPIGARKLPILFRAAAALDLDQSGIGYGMLVARPSSVAKTLTISFIERVESTTRNRTPGDLPLQRSHLEKICPT
jgi:hypothetical protein